MEYNHRTLKQRTLAQSAPVEGCVYTDKRGLTTSAGYFLGEPCKKCHFEELALEKEDEPKKLRMSSIFRTLGINPLYVYKCDANGRVEGGRLPLQSRIVDYERVLVVGQHDERFFHVVNSH